MMFRTIKRPIVTGSITVEDAKKAVLTLGRYQALTRRIAKTRKLKAQAKAQTGKKGFRERNRGRHYGRMSAKS